MHTTFLFLTAFLASTVEVVEMMTILLGVGMTSGWRSVLLGAGAGLAVLMGVVEALGPTLALFPIGVLRAGIGVLLLLFGAQWLRKGIFRTSLYGLGARTKATGRSVREDCISLDWTAFVLAFKGVLLEGLEVVFVVVAFGAATGRLGLAAEAALAAFAIVTVVTVFAGALLRDVPDHAIKLAVGLLLTTYGTFWSGEGLGVEWPGRDLAIPVILSLYLLYSFICLAVLRRIASPGGGAA